MITKTPNDERIGCDECGKRTPHQWQVQGKHADQMGDAYGTLLCWDCLRKLHKELIKFFSRTKEVVS